MKRNGFTLIELLIVVAIIGILAAIAVPNFLNAQMRARIARVVSDMKALATAEEQYRIDRGQYTYDGDCGVGGAENLSYRPLTTPVAYIASIPEDPFSAADPKFQNQQNIKQGLKPVFEYTSRVTFGPNGILTCKNNMTIYNTLGSIGVEYLMLSLGPNQLRDFDWSDTGYRQVVSGSSPLIYEPSNGLVSFGDIYVLNSKVVGAGL